MGGMSDRRLRFGDYELDSRSRELLRDGQPVKLQPQPLRVLAILAEHRGEIVSRQQLRERIWGDATFVEFDDGLNYCIRQIRLALGDDASKPVYIETLPKQGYRFIAEVTPYLSADLSGPPASASSNGAPSQDKEPLPEQKRSPEKDPSPPVPSAGRAPKRKPIKTIAAIAACAAVAAGAGVWWMTLGRGSRVPYPLHVTRVSKLTSYPGDEREPAISPDGSYVAFSWSGPLADNYDIYIVQAGGQQQPLRLTTDPAPDSYPAWSPDGSQIVFIRREGQTADIITVPSLGGSERRLHRFFRIGSDLDFSQHPVLNWSPDGRSIVYSGQSGAGEKYRLFLLARDTGAVRPVSSPGMELSGDSSPALSPDGNSLAFVRYLAPLNGRLLIQSLGPGMIPQGEPEGVKTSGLAVRSPIWLEDGKQLLFADAARIFQWRSNEEALPIYIADGALGGMSVGPKKRGGERQVIIASAQRDADLWAIPLNKGGTKSTGPPQVLQRSTEWDSHPQFSPDGRHIVFCSSRSGAPEIWVADADGDHPRQLTHLGAHVLGYPNWSRDSTRIVFHARVPDVAEVYIVDINQGVAKQITQEDPGLALATWSNDGRFIYASTLVGGTATTHRFPAEGGPMQDLWEGALARETADGKYILYWKSQAPGIFRRSLQGDLAKNPEELLVPDFWPNNQLGGYALVEDGIYYVSGNVQGKPGSFRFFDYASHTSTDVAPPVPGLERGLTISPDRHRLVFAATREPGGDLLSLELR